MKLQFSSSCFLLLLSIPGSSLVKSFTMNQVGKHQHQHQYGTIGKATQIAQISEPTRCPSTSSALYSTVAPTSTSTVNQNNTANGKPQKAPHPYNKRHKSFTINEKVRHITNRLLYKKDKRYWDEHLTEDQMDKAKYAIQAWSQVTSSPSASQKGAENIERILKRLEREKQNGNPNIELTLVLYNLVIDVWAKSELPERAEAVLRQMQSMKNLYPNCIKSNNLPYNTVIHSWKRSGEGERAENILKMMRETNVEPDVISYNGVVLAYARNYHKYGYADHGHRVLEEMEQTNLTMDSFLYNAVMDAHAKSRGHESAKRAESLLIKMEEYGDDHKAQPNTISYTTVIDAYAKMQSNDSCVNAERIFRKMEAAHSAGNVNARPNNRSFNAVINAYVQTKNPGSALRAEEILMKMIDLSKSGYVDAKPNVVSFTTVMNGWAKSGESGSGERAQRLFDLAAKETEEGNIDALPNAFMYSALIDAWVKSRDLGSVQKAFDIFVELNRKFNEGETTVKPSTFLANQVMDAHSRSGQSGSGERAEEILAILDDLYAKYQDDEMKPNAQGYTITMTAWAKTRAFGKARKASQILARMEKAYKDGNRDAKPNVFAFTAVLNACAYTVGDIVETKEALQIASKTYRELCATQYSRPNSVTFVTFLRVCVNLIPQGPSQEAAIMSVFKKCRQHGQVSDLVLSILVKSLTNEQLSKTVGFQTTSGEISIDQIPFEWKCNVRESKRRTRR